MTRIGRPAPPLLPLTRGPSFEFIAYSVIALLAVVAPAVNYDDAAFFNYVNNVPVPYVFYYHNGYVHVVPQLVAYVLSPLPLVVQLVLYRVVPLAAAMWLFTEASRLLALRLDQRSARIVALASVLVLRVMAPMLWATLSYSMWLGLLAALFHVIRTNASRDRYLSLIHI